MPSAKPKKQVERFKAGAIKFAEMFADIAELEEVDRNISSRNGNTTVKIVFKPKGEIPATKAAKVGKKMAEHFHAWFCPTHHEEFEFFKIDYQRGEGTILLQGRI